MRLVQSDVFLAPPRRYGPISVHPLLPDSGMLRVALRLPGGRYLALHGFRPHRELYYHDHAWPFRTFVLWGSYVDDSRDEHGAQRLERLRAGMTRRRPASHRHRTSCARWCWTLVLIGKRERLACHGEPVGWVCDTEPAA